MKTLNEVIMCLEGCGHIDCDDCPYHYEDEKIEIDDCEQVYKDALQYLKMYKELADDSEAFAEWKENPPLTWDELKSMAGKPIWVEGSWEIIDSCNDDYFSTDSGAMYFRKNDECYGDYDTDWQAYRKERKE